MQRNNHRKSDWLSVVLNIHVIHAIIVIVIKSYVFHEFHMDHDDSNIDLLKLFIEKVVQDVKYVVNENIRFQLPGDPTTNHLKKLIRNERFSGLAHS